MFNGATLAWAGTQASLPASVYGGLAAGNGDGFNPNEFILDKGATLTNSYAALILGYQYTPVAGPVQNYGLPITVRSDTGNSTTPVNLGGTITAHSGIQMTTTGNVDLNVAAGSVITFANDIAGVGYTPVRSLTLNSTGLGNAANVTVAASFANTQTTTIQSRSTLTLNPGAAHDDQLRRQRGQQRHRPRHQRHGHQHGHHLQHHARACSICRPAGRARKRQR